MYLYDPCEAQLTHENAQLRRQLAEAAGLPFRAAVDGNLAPPETRSFLVITVVWVL